MEVKSFIKKLSAGVPFSGSIKFNEVMAKHTTFKTGGPADLFIRPAKKVFLSWVPALLKSAEAEGIPVFILGGGANLLVSDRGIRGIVLDTGAWSGIEEKQNTEGEGNFFSIKILSGTTTAGALKRLAAKGLSGLEFLAGLPGSIGGAVWMNARCYEKSISDVLIESVFLDENCAQTVMPFNAEDFAYKKSPFQQKKSLILSASFRVKPGLPAEIKKEMAGFVKDRKEKGHYRFPSAGSAFKNSRIFGAPTGKIIDELGLKGQRRGGAMVAPWHGNLIVNAGNASSADIRFLMEDIIKKAREEKGFELEPEIIFAGEWEQHQNK